MGELTEKKIDIYDRCEAFSCRVLGMFDETTVSFEIRPIISQTIRSATSVTANMVEASEAQSNKDFVHKLSIALKEAKETLYWIRVLKTRKSLKLFALEEMFTEGQEIVKILAAIKNKMVARVSSD